MAGIRPPLLDAALRSCTRARRAPALRNAPFSKRSPVVQRRWIGDMNGKPPVPPGGGVGKNTVVAPKTRIAVGVVFIGALIYSMVRNTYKSRTNGKDG
jgi:coproporphyrinogen III oxidase